MVLDPRFTPPVAAPSILSADFSRLGEEIGIVDPARDWVHCDIMDNHFVPNLTFGPILVRAVRRLTSAFLDVHLMVERPATLAPAFREAGADQITLHLEACRPAGVPLEAFDPRKLEPRLVDEAIAAVRATGARAGLAIKPKTPFEAVEPWLDSIDILLVMTVEPGFGGQTFMADILPKVTAAAERRRQGRGRFLIEVDGGIDPETAPSARAAGADVFVAGNAVFGRPEPRRALEALRGSLGG